MKSIIALESIIKEEEKRISMVKRQLSDHESGEHKLTFLDRTSSENSLEITSESLTKHQSMLNELLASDLGELEEKERIEAAILRKNYFKYQKVRIHRDIAKSNDLKLEAMHILDELPENIEFEDDTIIDIAVKSIELGLVVHEEIENQYQMIKSDFEKLIKDCKDEHINELVTLNNLIPIVVLHFSVLLSNIKENNAENKKVKISGFPKFEDWWIKELWYSHQAYFGLYKWRQIIENICNTPEQKRSWDKIFSNWIFIKKAITNKGELCFKYNFAFDTIIHKYAELEEETIETNLISMETIVNGLIKKENFNTLREKHQIDTDYLLYKREQNQS